MKKNRLFFLVFVLLILVAIYFKFFKGGFSTIGHSDHDFAVKDTGSITKIFIANKNNQSVTLTRKNKGEWLVNDHFIARPDCINTLLYTINMLDVKTVIDPRSWNNIIKNLAVQAVKVEIYEGDKRMKVYYVGGETADELGTYMLLSDPETEENYKQPYIIYIPGFDGYLTTRYFIKEDDWRDRSIFQYYPYDLKSVSIEYPQADSSFRINIEGKNHFMMDNPVTGQKATALDTVAVKQYLTYYQSVSWEVTAITSKKDSIISTIPIAIIKVEDIKGKVTELKLFHRKAAASAEGKYGIDYTYDPDRIFALINNKDFVVVQYFVFGKILQPATYFSPFHVNMLKKSE
jgi:hypothetical protein